MSTLEKELGYYKYQLEKNLSNQRALRLSFGLQILGMFLNNIAFFVIWLFFIKAIGPTNGWGVLQVFGLLSVSILTFGLSYTLFGGVYHLPDKVVSGAFDSMLTKPKSLYLRILNQEFSVSAIGDLIQGIIGTIAFLILAHASLQQVLLLVVMLPPAVMIHGSFTIIADSLIFWFPQAEQLNKAFHDLVILPSTQPIALLQGLMKFIYIFVIPAMLLAGLPVEAFSKFDLKLVVVGYGVAFAWFAISRFVLRRAVARYESANFFG